MRYRIEKYDDRHWPQYRSFLKWRPILDLMNAPSRFGTRHGAETFIKRFHCNHLNNTASRRIKWGRTTTPKIN